MLVSPEFALWIISGVDPKGGPADSRSQQDRFAEHEREVMNLTNGIHAAGGRLNLPWPHALGTPPWGAQKELESGPQGMNGAAYAMRLVRLGSSSSLRQAHRDLVGLLRPDLPALLYLGNAWAPRHVTLVMPASAGELNVYDPATGAVTELAPEPFAGRTLGIAGWNVPWIVVQPG